MLRSMLTRTSQKVGLAFVFGLVGIDIVFDILRTVYTASLDLANFPDKNTLWVILEPTIAVVVCALPCYRGFLSWNTGSLVSMSVGIQNSYTHFGLVHPNIVDTEKEGVQTDETGQNRHSMSLVP